MKKNYIVPIDEWINENYSKKNIKLEEGVGDIIRSGKRKIKSFFDSVLNFFTTNIKSKVIKSGLKAGTQTVVTFDPKKGSVLSQLKNYYKDTDYGKLNSIQGNLVKESRDEESHELTLEWPIQGDGMPRNLSPSAVQESIRDEYTMVREGYRPRPIFIYGAPGIGKSEIVADFCDEMNIALCVMDLSMMDPTDLLGVGGSEYIVKPKYDETDSFRTRAGEVVSLKTHGSSLPTEDTYGTNGGILFLDEMTNAKDYMFDAANQLIQQGRVQEWVLPKNWMIICAGNRPADNPNVIDLSDNAPLLNRFYNVNLMPKLEDWLSWIESNNRKVAQDNEAIKTGTNPADVGKVIRSYKDPKTGEMDYHRVRRTYVFPEIGEFVKGMQTIDPLFYRLYKSGPKKSGGGFASPRGWVNVASVMNTYLVKLGLKDWKDLDFYDQLFRERIYEAVGEYAGGLLLEYLETIQHITPEMVKNIFKNGDKEPIISGIQDKPAKLLGAVAFLIREISLIPDGNQKFISLKNLIFWLTGYKNLESIAGGLALAVDKIPEFNTKDGKGIGKWTDVQIQAYEDINKRLSKEGKKLMDVFTKI